MRPGLPGQVSAFLADSRFGRYAAGRESSPMVLRSAGINALSRPQTSRIASGSRTISPIFHRGRRLVTSGAGPRHADDISFSPPPVTPRLFERAPQPRQPIAQQEHGDAHFFVIYSAGARDGATRPFSLPCWARAIDALEARAAPGRQFFSGHCCCAAEISTTQATFIDGDCARSRPYSRRPFQRVLASPPVAG